MKLTPIDDTGDVTPKLKLTPTEDPVIKKPQESYMKGFLQSAGHSAMTDAANTIGAFGSQNPIAKLLGTDRFTSPADIAANYIKDKAGTIDETQPGTTTGKLLSDVVTTIPMSAEKVVPNAIMGFGHGFGVNDGGFVDRLKAGLTEGAIQGGTSAIPATFGALIRGFKPSKNAKELMNLDIQPTVGQGINQDLLGRSIRKIEEAYTSIPFLGSTARMSRDRAIGEWDKHVLDKIELPSHNISTNGATGNEAIDNLYGGFNDTYDRLLAGHTVPIRGQAVNDIRTAIANTDRYIKPKDRQWLTDFVQNQFDSIPSNGNIYSADAIKHIESKLGEKARELAQKNPDLSNTLDDIEGVITKHRQMGLPSVVSKGLEKVDAKYAMFKRVQKASTALGAEDGKFTPSHLLGAVKVMDKSKDKVDFSRGKALLQGISSQGKTVLKDTLGESGTAPRAMVATGLAGGTAGAAMLGQLPAYAALLATSMAGATRPIQKALLGGYKYQLPVAAVIDKTIRPAGIAGYVASNNERRPPN
jgi:hypothetical protein